MGEGEEDYWYLLQAVVRVRIDWLLHFSVSLCIVFVLCFVMPLPAACMLTMAIGITKELVDVRPELGDIIADVLGTTIGASLWMLFS